MARKTSNKSTGLLKTKGTRSEEQDYAVSHLQNRPTEKERDKTEFVYDEFDEMIDVRDQSYNEFNGRTLKQFIDDNQKRANGFVPSRESQGKEGWQSNVFVQTTRAKVKAILASAAKNPPEISMTAVNEENEVDVDRSEVMKHLVESSYLQGEDAEEDNNPELAIFYNGWDCSINGTVILYDGYLKTKHAVKKITKYDLVTGEIEWTESEQIVDDRPIELSIPLAQIFIKNIYIRDIQKQPAIIWVDYYTEDDFNAEFGQYKNAKFVKSASNFNGVTSVETDTFFLRKRWEGRCTEDNFEVIRYYNKKKDIYRIICNGVLLLDSPMLWGRTKKKYPFAKQIFEPFANSKFFYGNSLPNILMAEQDVENSFTNSMTDKTYRSFATPTLIGLANKDSFDLEDEYVDTDTKIYVDNVDQVKQFPVSQVNNSEVQMLNIIRGNQDRSSTDGTQSGAANGDATARGIVIANERAEEIKGLFFTMMKDLWLQKYRLRTITIAMNYSRRKVEAITGKEGADTFDGMVRRFIIPKAKLSDGMTGNLQVEVVNERKDLQSDHELDVRETMKRIKGQPTEIIQITSVFLDNYEYIIAIQSENMYQKSKALKMALTNEKITGAAKMFPDIFTNAQDEFFKEYMEGYGDNAEHYLQAANKPQQTTQPGMGGGAPGQPSGGAGGADMAAILSKMGGGAGAPEQTPTPGAAKLPALSGT